MRAKCTCVINCVGLKDFQRWLRLGSHSPMKCFTGLLWLRCRPARRSPKSMPVRDSTTRGIHSPNPRLWAWFYSPGHSLRAEAGSILGRIDCCCCASIAVRWGWSRLRCDEDGFGHSYISGVALCSAKPIRTRSWRDFHDYISVLEIASGRSCIRSRGGVTAVRYVLLTAFLGSDTRLG